MGCDIHLFVEKLNPVTHDWEKVGPVFFDNFYAGAITKDIMTVFGIDEDEAWEVVEKYRKGEAPINRTEQYILGKYFPKRIAKEDMKYWDAIQMGLLPYPYSDSPYGGRCYALFGILAGVRDSSNPIIGGISRHSLPPDVSPEIRNMSDQWGYDAHSHNYFTIEELLDSNYAKMSDTDLRNLGIDPYFFFKTIPALLSLGKKDEVRIVFWFDN